MIDIHSHILWGIDDGAATLDDSIAIAKEAAKNGTKSIIATPHFIEGSYMAPVPIIKEKVARLNREIVERGLDLKIFTGQEIYLSADTGQKLEEGRLLTLAQSRYALVEFPMMAIPDYAERALYDLMRRGYLPIIAHPERISSVGQDLTRLISLIDRGCLLQINSTSIEGGFGKKIQEIAHALADSKMIHFIASDSHDTNSRGPALTGAFDKLGQWGHGDLIEKTGQNAKAVIENAYIDIEDPVLKKKKKSLLGRIFNKK